MIRAFRLDPAATGETLIARLPYDARHRRRLTLTTESGERVLLDLAEATRLRAGDRVAMEDGRVLLIEAEPEAIAEIVPGAGVSLAQLAWHLGNRHTPTAVLADRLLIHRDHVLEAMAERLGATVTHRDAPFDPVVGAYHDGGGSGHHHDHGHDHHHDHHDHGHD